MSVKITTFFTLFNCKILLNKLTNQLYNACYYHIKVYYAAQSLLIDTIKNHSTEKYTYYNTRQRKQKPPSYC